MQVIDLTSQHARMLLSGPDAARYLNGQISNDVGLCKGEQGIAACVCNAKGKLEGTVNVNSWDQGFLVDFPVELLETLSLRLEKYLISDDCAWSDLSKELKQFHVIDEDPQSIGEKLADVACTVIRNHRYGKFGTDVFCAKQSVGDLLNRLASHGATFPSANEMEEFRIANCGPKWGAELGTETLPQEANLESTHISFTKGCYIGQETISRIKSVGRVNRRLVTLTLDSLPSMIKVGDEIFRESDFPEGKPIGKVTSVASSGPRSLAYLHRTALEGDEPLIVSNTEKSLSRSIRILHS